MKYWPLIQAAGTTKKDVLVKVKPMKLEGLFFKGKIDDAGKGRMVVVVKMKWEGPKSSGLVPFYRVSSCQRNYSSQIFLKNGECIEWEGDEFESVCDFWLASKDNNNSFLPWDVSFSVLWGDEDAKSRKKLASLGNVRLNIAELASGINPQIERKLPVSLQTDGAVSQATLLIGVSFAEVRNSYDSAKGSKRGLFRGITVSKKEKELVQQMSSSDSEESCVLESDGSTGTSSSSTSERSSKIGLFSWKKRRLSFSLSRKKVEPFVEKTSVNRDKCVSLQEDSWEVKEFVSRNGQAKLKTNIFLASIDQRSEKAAGESACTAIVAVIANWLHSNPEFMPTSSQFDNLITEGSSEWRKLCDNEAYMNSFPDNHFDLETIVKANLRPLTMLHEASFTGIFSPEKFENLKGAHSFDDIWQEITSNVNDYGQRIYIVSWNDHFFVLKIDADAYYIIDSLGERLFEGCNQAYILKFDDSSLMYGKVAKEEAASEEMAGAEKLTGKEESDVSFCKGKECCKEFIKRFFAAIPLGELEEEEKRETVSTFSLLKRLQIDFHYCSSSQASSSSSPLSPPSVPFSDEGCIT